MQNAKDTFYVTLRDNGWRAVNAATDDRAARAVTRPGSLGGMRTN